MDLNRQNSVFGQKWWIFSHYLDIITLAQSAETAVSLKAISSQKHAQFYQEACTVVLPKLKASKTLC